MSAGADVIVVGGGIHGSSTAFHLARRGIRPLLLEKDHVARHASGVNAGGVRTLARHFAEVPLSLAAMEIWHGIHALLDDDCGFESHGQVMIAESEDEMAALRRRVADLNALGFFHEAMIDAGELRALVPAIAAHCRGGVVARRDGAAIPFRATTAFARAAVRLGARVVEGARVERVARRGALWRVETSAGGFEAPALVNCAGAWADRIAAQLGEPVPLEVVAPMLMITARLPRFIKPVLIAAGRTLSFKQFANGTVLIGGGHRGRAARDANRTDLDWGRLATSAETVWELVPIMRSAQIVRAWAGIEARMPDDLPVIGPSSTHEACWHGFGFSAHGFQLGPIVGAILAELVATGRTDMPIAPFAIGRFADLQPAGSRSDPPGGGTRPSRP